MRNLIIQLPETNELKDPSTEEYARLLNIELDSFRRDLNRYVSKVVITTVAADYSITATDELIVCTESITVTLPSAVSSKGKTYFIKNAGSGTVTVTGSEEIDEEDEQNLSQYESIHAVSDGTEWWII